MSGNISTPEYTFFDLVHNYIAGVAKVNRTDFGEDFKNPNNIKRVRIKLARYIQKLNWILVWDPRILINNPVEHHLSPAPGPAINEDNPRPQRQRRAPNRLNIASTKGRSCN